MRLLPEHTTDNQPRPHAAGNEEQVIVPLQQPAKS